MTTNSELNNQNKGVQKTRERILLAAAEIFSQNGFSATTTRSIADTAGLNELTIFRYFKTKKLLFEAVIAQFSPLQELDDLFTNKLTWNYRNDLMMIGTRFFNSVFKRRKEILMSLFEAQRQMEVHEANQGTPLKMVEKMSSYLQEQMDRGQVRNLDTRSAAQAFFGMFLASAINGRNSIEDSQIEKTVKDFVDLFYFGTAQ